MPALSAWQGLVVHGGLEAGERVLITGARGGVGHFAVQLVRALGGALVGEGEACDLLFDTAGGAALTRSADRAGRIVTIAAEAPGADYFIVEPNGAQLASLPELRPEIDSVFPLEDFRAAFDRWQSGASVGRLCSASPRSQERKAGAFAALHRGERLVIPDPCGEPGRFRSLPLCASCDTTRQVAGRVALGRHPWPARPTP